MNYFYPNLLFIISIAKEESADEIMIHCLNTPTLPFQTVKYGIQLNHIYVSIAPC